MHGGGPGSSRRRPGWYNDFGFLYYRSDLLAKYNFSEPGPQGWTYDELEEIARVVQEGERGSGTPGFDGWVWMGKAYEGLTCFALEVVAGHGGGQLLDADGQVTVNNTGFRQALRRMVKWLYGDMGSVPISTLAVLQYTEVDMVRRFCEERTAMFARNWPYMIGKCNAAGMVGKFAVVRNAGLTRGGGRGSQGGWAFGVNARSDHLEQAVKFVELAVSRQQQLDFWYNYNWLPTRADLASDQSLCANQAATVCMRRLADVVNSSLQPFLPEGSPDQMAVFLASSGVCPPVRHQATICDVDVTDYLVARPALVARDRYSEVSRVFWTTIHNALGKGAGDVEESVISAECELIQAMGSWVGPSYCHSRWALVCAPGSFFSVEAASVAAMSRRQNTTANVSGVPTDVDGLQFCLPCLAGTHTNTSGQTGCSLCPSGKHSDIGATKCTPCQPGFKAPSQGMRQCDPCEIGTYSDKDGSRSCTSCPAPMTTQRQLSNSSEDCGCFAQLPFFRRSSDGSKAWCEDCPKGLLCPGGRQVPRQAEGYMAGVPEFEGAIPPFIVKCDLKKCPANLELGSCPAHREGLGCNLCMVDYAPNGNGECVPCLSRNNSGSIIFTVIFIGVVLLCLVLVTRTKVKVQRSEAVTILMCCSLTVNTLQSLTVFSQLSLNWVEPIPSLKRVLDLVAFKVEFLSLECVLRSNSPLLGFALSLLAYPVFACLLTLAAVLWKLRGGSVSRNQLLNMQGFVLTVIYLSVALTAVNPLRCERNPDSTLSMVLNRDVLCWTSSTHRGLVVLAICGILVYLVGVVVLVVWGTFNYPRRISRPDAADFLLKYSFLFSRVREPCYFYCLIYVLRNVAIAIIPVVFAQNASLQIASMTFTVLAVGMLQCRLFPWRSWGSNVMDVCFTVVLILISSLGAMLADVSKAEAEVVVQTMLLVLMGSLAGIVAIMILGTVALRLFRRRRFAVFLSHHKEGAGVLARFFKLGLRKLTSQDVFLDSDNLRHLDHIVSTIAFDTDNVIVLLTRLTLTRPWCAVEIAAAVEHHVNIVLVACDDFIGITDDFIEQVPRLWSVAQWTAMSRVGISVEDVQEAYRIVQGMSTLQLNYRMSEQEQQLVVKAAFGLCHHRSLRHGWRPRFCLRFGSTMSAMERTKTERWNHQQAVDVLLLSNTDQAEAVSTSYVLRMMLQAKTRLRVAVMPADRHEAAKALAKASFLVLVLTPGLLERPQTAGLLAEALVPGQLEVVPLLACSSFTFPDANFLDRMREGAIFSQQHPAIQPLTLQEVSVTYQTVFEVLAARFSPHGSQQIQEAEVEELCLRLPVDASGRPRPTPLTLRQDGGSMTASHLITESVKKGSSKVGLGPLGPASTPLTQDEIPAGPQAMLVASAETSATRHPVTPAGKPLAPEDCRWGAPVDSEVPSIHVSRGPLPGLIRLRL